jgi:hypothetical protein
MPIPYLSPLTPYGQNAGQRAHNNQIKKEAANAAPIIKGVMCLDFKKLSSPAIT